MSTKTSIIMNNSGYQSMQC